MCFKDFTCHSGGVEMGCNRAPAFHTTKISLLFINY